MSFLTCFWLLPQKEHLSRSESPNFAMPPGPFLVERPGLSLPRPPRLFYALLGGGCSKLRCNSAARDDLVDDAVVLRFLGRQDEVAIGVPADTLQGLSGVNGDQLIEKLAIADDLLGLDLDVDRLALGAAVRLVQQHPRMREGESLTASSG